MPENRKVQAARLIRAYVGPHCNVGLLIGPSNAGPRQSILSTLSGKLLPKSRCGINALESALVEAFGPFEGSCKAVRDDALHARLKEVALSGES